MALQIPTQIELDGQYRALREHAGLLERDERRSILVTGAEAADFLQGQLTNDVESLEPNQGAYSALLDRKGHMQADMRVLRTEHGFRLDTEDVAADAVVRHLSLYKVGRDVNVEEVTDAESILSLIGPASSEIALSGPLGPEHAQSEGQLDGASFVAVATERRNRPHRCPRRGRGAELRPGRARCRGGQRRGCRDRPRRSRAGRGSAAR